MKGLSNCGNARIGADVSASVSIRNAFSHCGVHLNFTSFFNKAVSGEAIWA